jgi:HTH-type transcriptional regulator / antitoxin HipB
MIDSKELADVIKLHRKAAKLTQVQLAEMAGVGKTVVFDIERGKESIRLDTLRKILNVLNIKVQLTSPLMTNLQININAKS